MYRIPDLPITTQGLDPYGYYHIDNDNYHCKTRYLSKLN